MKKKKLITILISIATIILVAVFCWNYLNNKNKIIQQNNPADTQNIASENSVFIKENKQGEKELFISPISGIESENGNRRPFAVMLAADETVRPLAGIGQADLVVEMPVIQNGINRFMAVYVAESPSKIGSIRSARHDFIPLAKGLNAIFAHWGGSHFALDKLNAHVIDNLDALINLHNTFYRDKNIPKPDNGFTSMEKMLNASEKLKYNLKNNREVKNIISENDWSPEAGGWVYNGENIVIDYPEEFKVEWIFNKDDKLYYRYRGDRPEIDRNTNKQVTAKVVALITAKSRHLEGQYNDVDIEGVGKLKIYQNGFYLEGKWIKDKSDQSSPMRFVNNSGYDIQLLPGQRWWEVIS